MRSVVAALLVLLALVLAACAPASSNRPRSLSGTQNVPVGFSSSQMLWLTAGERLSGQVNVSGGEGVEAGLAITVEGPGGIILDLGKVRGARSLAFETKDTGNHIIHFRNLSATAEKKVDYALTPQASDN